MAIEAGNMFRNFQTTCNAFLHFFCRQKKNKSMRMTSHFRCIFLHVDATQIMCSMRHVDFFEAWAIKLFHGLRHSTVCGGGHAVGGGGRRKKGRRKLFFPQSLPGARRGKRNVLREQKKKKKIRSIFLEKKHIKTAIDRRKFRRVLQRLPKLDSDFC